MQNISFTSNFRFNVGRNFPYNAVDRIYSYEFKKGTVREYYPTFEEASKTGVFQKLTLTVPDEFDREIESYCSQKGIDYKKQTFDEAMDLENIKKRIQIDRYSDKSKNHLVELDVKTLDDLFKKDAISYIEPNGVNGIGNRYKKVGEYLKTGENIDATIVHFEDFCGQLRARISDGRHRFAYLRDLGMQKIMVQLDDESLQLAKKFKLIV